MSEGRDRGSGLRTIALLKLVAECEGPFTLGELASKALLPPSSVHRLLQPLVREGLVERAAGQSYQAGSEFLRIASLVIRHVDVGRLARPILQRLWEQWEETSSLCLYKPDTQRAIVVETIQTPHPLRFVIEPFSELSLSWGSLGRSILAFLPPDDATSALRRIGPGPLSGLPPPEDMETIVQDIRTWGFAHYRDETIDAAGVAAPVFRADGTILGSLGVTAPARRLTADRVSEIADTVMAAAEELSRMLGHVRQVASSAGRRR
ncbi:MAG: IclR family transcriptional regulator [Sphingobium sp.]|nr:IclR family transcriptional regulator [Sphingobium sp.]